MLLQRPKDSLRAILFLIGKNENTFGNLRSFSVIERLNLVNHHFITFFYKLLCRKFHVL